MLYEATGTGSLLCGLRIRRSDFMGRRTQGPSLPTVREAILLNAPLALIRLTAVVITVAVLEPQPKGTHWRRRQISVRGENPRINLSRQLEPEPHTDVI